MLRVATRVPIPASSTFARNATYASGNLGKSLVGSFVEIFALFYLTDILNVPPALAGLILLISLIWDGITDPLMGIAADRLRQSLSTASVFFFVGAPITALAFVAFFNAAHVPPGWQLPYLLATLLLFRTAYTVVDVPHNTMLGLMTDDPRQRTNITSLRIFFSSAGRIGVTLAAIYFLQAGGPEASAPRFTHASVVLSVAYVLILLFCLRSVSRIVIRAPPTMERLHMVLSTLVRTMRQNRQLQIVFGLTALTSLTVPVLSSAILYFSKYALYNVELASLVLLAMAGVQAASLYFWSKFSNRLQQKKHASQLANAILAAVGLTFMLLLDSPEGLYVLAALVGFAIGGIHMLNWSMLPDAMDDRPAADSQRLDMSIFSLYTLINKICMGLSQALTGLVLAVFGYQANSDIPPDTIGAIVTTLIALPAIGSLGCICLLRHQTLRQTDYRQST